MTDHTVADNDDEGNDTSINQFKDYSGFMPTTNQNLREAYPDVCKNPSAIKFAQVKEADQIVEFFPVLEKGPKYLKYCTGWLSEDEKPNSTRKCIRKYTSGEDWYCTTINMALATDSRKLKEYGKYIKHLKYSIGMSPMNFNGTVFRGVDMSRKEIAAYENENMFFIPSFTSTSITQPFRKNTLFHIDISPKWSKFCVEITPDLTKYSSENEILFSCYNLYQYVRTEKSNGQRIIKLRLKNYEKYYDYDDNTILN